jgi:HK97 gp10 family phage protein
MSIKLEGFDEFLKAVQAMPDQMKTKTMREIIKKNMTPIATSIKNQAPIHKDLRTVTRIRKSDGKVFKYTAGNLRRSIDVRTFARNGEVTGYAGINKKNIADGYYGFFLERGTKTIPKNPFISRAAAVTVPLAAETLQTDVKNYIVKNAKKLGLDAK